MAKKLQIILHDAEYWEIRRIARARRMSVAEWVRQAIEGARERNAAENVGRKLEAIRLAARFDYPTDDIDQMLVQIDDGTDSVGSHDPVARCELDEPNE